MGSEKTSQGFGDLCSCFRHEASIAAPQRSGKGYLHAVTLGAPKLLIELRRLANKETPMILGVTTFTLQGETFVAVSAATDKALSVLHLGAGANLIQ